MVLHEGKFWNVYEVVQEGSPPERGQGFHRTWLAKGKYSTVNVVQGQPAQPPGPDLLHLHKEHDEIIYVVEANTDFRLGEFTKRIKAGDVIFVPAGTVHGPTGGEKLVLVSVYAPSFDPDNPDREDVR